MTITYKNKTEFEDLYLHDFNIKEFNYNDLEKNITMRATNGYIKKEIYFKFTNVLLCEITGEEHRGGIDIIDWYVLPENEKVIALNKPFQSVGIALIKASMDTVKIYCEKIDVEEKDFINKANKDKAY